MQGTEIQGGESQTQCTHLARSAASSYRGAVDAGRPDSWSSRLLSRGPAGGAVSRRGEDRSRSGGLKGDREMMSSAVVAVPVGS